MVEIGDTAGGADRAFRLRGIADLPDRKFKRQHEVFPEGGMDYVSGVGKLNGRLVILLDLKKIVRRGGTPKRWPRPATLVTVDADHSSPIV